MDAGLTASPAAAVIHRYNPTNARRPERAGSPRRRGACRCRRGHGASMSTRATPRSTPPAWRWYSAREELVFVHSLPVLPPGVTLKEVKTDADGAASSASMKRSKALPMASDDGSAGGRAGERKCGDVHECYLAEIDRETVGAIGTSAARACCAIKNLVVHPPTAAVRSEAQC